MGAIPLFSAGKTDQGGRGSNEDSHLVEPPLFAVADGVARTQEGGMASSITVETLAREFRASTWAMQTGFPEPFLRFAITRAHAQIRKRRDRNPSVTLATTIVCAIVTDDLQAAVANVGDSRGYHWSKKARTLTQLTADHTEAQEQLRSGKLTARQMRQMSTRDRLDLESTLTRAVGAGETVLIDTQTLRLEEGDALLLCSDGLTGILANFDIAKRFGNGSYPKRIADMLIADALAQGGDDNITVVVCGVGESYQPPE